MNCPLGFAQRLTRFERQNNALSASHHWTVCDDLPERRHPDRTTAEHHLARAWCYRDVHQVIARNAEPAGLTSIRRGITGHHGRRGSGIENRLFRQTQLIEMRADRNFSAIVERRYCPAGKRPCYLGSTAQPHRHAYDREAELVLKDWPTGASPTPARHQRPMGS